MYLPTTYTTVSTHRATVVCVNLSELDPKLLQLLLLKLERREHLSVPAYASPKVGLIKTRTPSPHCPARGLTLNRLDLHSACGGVFADACYMCGAYGLIANARGLAGQELPCTLQY